MWLTVCMCNEVNWLNVSAGMRYSISYMGHMSKNKQLYITTTYWECLQMHLILHESKIHLAYQQGALWWVVTKNINIQNAYLAHRNKYKWNTQRHSVKNVFAATDIETLRDTQTETLSPPLTRFSFKAFGLLLWKRIKSILLHLTAQTALIPPLQTLRVEKCQVMLKKVREKFSEAVM